MPIQALEAAARTAFADFNRLGFRTAMSNALGLLQRELPKRAVPPPALQALRDWMVEQQIDWRTADAADLEKTMRYASGDMCIPLFDTPKRWGRGAAAAPTQRPITVKADRRWDRGALPDVRKEVHFCIWAFEVGHERDDRPNLLFPGPGTVLLRPSDLAYLFALIFKQSLRWSTSVLARSPPTGQLADVWARQFRESLAVVGQVHSTWSHPQADASPAEKRLSRICLARSIRRGRRVDGRPLRVRWPT